MRIKLLILLCLNLVLFSVYAAWDDDEPMKKMKQMMVVSFDTVGNAKVEYVAPDENLNDIFEPNLDSLENSWFIQNVFVPDSLEVNFSKSAGNLFPDSVYVQHLQEIEQEVDLSYNETVKNFIELYTVRRREQVEIMLGLSQHYFPMFEEALDRYNLPLELKYLSIIESALNPQARSRVGATGLWQFMLGTARILNLEVSTFIDERRDPLKSTDAAAKYLRQLYDIYQDWYLVIAAYNCGPGNVNKAIKRAGGKMDYWSIYYRLPRETRGYVPAFIAATYVMNYFSEHRLVPRVPEFPVVTDTIVVNQYLHFNQLTANLGVDVEELRILNPMFRRDVIPGKPNKPYVLRLPVEKISDFVLNEDSIYNYQRDKYFPNNTLAQPAALSSSAYTPVDITGKGKVYYTVKAGDNIGFICAWFNVRASDLRYWNDINRNLIKAGQKLLVYVPESQKSKYAEVNNMSFEAKQSMIGKSTTVSAPKDNAATAVASAPAANSGATGSDFIYYTVRKGDNFWTISKKFPGVTNYDIMKINNIKDAGSLVIGQKLKIKPKV